MELEGGEEDETEVKGKVVKKQKNKRSFGNAYHIFKEVVTEDLHFLKIVVVYYFMYMGRKMNKNKNKMQWNV